MFFPQVASKLDSSYSRVPLEIWQKIFLLVSLSEHIPILAQEVPVWTPPGFVSSPGSSSNSLVLPSTPVTLASVSSGWRRCAHGMPDLWAVLFVKVPKSIRNHGDNNRDDNAGHTDNPNEIETQMPDMDTSEQLASLVKTRLSLSQSLPLKICIVAKDNQHFGRSIIRAIIPFSRQWETIHLYTPTETYSEFYSLKHESDFPNLRSIHILPQIYSRVDPHDAFRLDNVPFFTELSNIKEFHTSLIPSSTSPIFPRLEEFHVRATRSETRWLSQILVQCNELKVLTLSGYGLTVQGHTPSVIPQIMLPELETLILEHPPGREMLINLLTLPKLKTIFLGGRCHGRVWTDSILDVIDRLKERSNIHSLNRLWIYLEMHGMDPVMLVNTLRKNGALRELRINQALTVFGKDLIVPSFFNALAGEGRGEAGSGDEEDEHGILCPKLELLHLATNSLAILEYPELINLLERRCFRHPPAANKHSDFLTLHMHLELWTERTVSKTVLDVCREWKKKGYCIDVEIVY